MFGGIVTISPVDPVTLELDALRGRLDRARPFNIGFPGATDFNYAALSEFFAVHLLNNVGDPYVDGAAVNHAKPFEREVVEFCADLFRAPPGQAWGYVTTGGSEGNLYALWLARSLHPDAMAYVSDAAHYSVRKALEVLAVPYVVVGVDGTGEIDHADLADQVARHRHRPAVVAATAGTTMSEAVDDVRQINRILDALAIRRRFVHVDAALSGIPLALVDPDDRPGFDFVDGADSIAVSGHKFLGAPFPCGVVVVRSGDRDRVARAVGYTGSPDSTLTGSRSGHAALLLWYAIRRYGREGLRARAEAARSLAAHVHARLTELGWEAYRHPHAFTVVLRTPPAAVARRWVLASAGGWSHVVTMPGVTRESVEEFLADMKTAAT
jgi:histidine decarboxylase